MREAWIIDGKISYAPPQSGPVEEVRGFIYPGLVDCHAHPGLSWDEELVSDAELRRRYEGYAAHGVTAIRDCGGQRNPTDIQRIGDPKVKHSGRQIARPKRYFRHMPAEIEPNELPDEMVRQAEVSNGWVKLIGDWIDRSNGADSDLEPLWGRSELIDGVAAVHEMGKKVTVHTFATETIDDLLEAGVDGIEHGTGMAREHVQEAHSRGILIDPTVLQIMEFPDIAAQAAKYPKYAARMNKMDANRREHLAMMVEEKSHFLMGTDNVGNVHERSLPAELVAAVEQGMPTDVVMDAASFGGRARVDFTSWEENAAADFVVYDDDPLVNIHAVETPRAVFIDGIEAPVAH